MHTCQIAFQEMQLLRGVLFSSGLYSCRKPRTINFNNASPGSPKPPLCPGSLPLSAPDQSFDQATPSDSSPQAMTSASPSAYSRMLSETSQVAIDQLPFASSESAAATRPATMQPFHGHNVAIEPILETLCQQVGSQLADSPNTGLPVDAARSESMHDDQLRTADSLPVQHPPASSDCQCQQKLQASTVVTRQLQSDIGAAPAHQQFDPHAQSAASFLDDIISKSDKGTLFKGPVAASGPSPLQIPAPASVSSRTATHVDAYSLNQDCHKQQADEAVHLAGCAEKAMAPMVGRQKSSEQLGRALSSRESMREGDFASLLLPGHSLSVSELGRGSALDQSLAFVSDLWHLLDILYAEALHLHSVWLVTCTAHADVSQCDVALSPSGSCFLMGLQLAWS